MAPVTRTTEKSWTYSFRATERSRTWLCQMCEMQGSCPQSATGGFQLTKDQNLHVTALAVGITRAALRALSDLKLRPPLGVRVARMCTILFACGNFLCQLVEKEQVYHLCCLALL